MTKAFELLPDIHFAQKDAKLIEQEIIQRFEDFTGRKLYPGDPLRLTLLTIAYYVALLRNAIDDTGKQNLLKFAREGALEHIAALVGTYRLKPKAASVTMRFTLSAAQPEVTFIPKGTRVTPGNNLHFATTKVLEIPAGALSGEASAECTISGTVGNDYLPGQINQLSDPFPFGFIVTNITTSQGGADTEETESFRERTRLAPEGFSTAGPDGAYTYWAKTASQRITDVAVFSPSPGIVEIVPLLMNGEIPEQSVLDAVAETCGSDTRRPLTDYVVVSPPEIIHYDIDLTYYISRRDSVSGISIQENVKKAVDNYCRWQREALGRDINPDELIKLLRQAGSKRAEISAPSFFVVKKNQVAYAAKVSVRYGGLEDD